MAPVLVFTEQTRWRSPQIAIGLNDKMTVELTEFGDLVRHARHDAEMTVRELTELAGEIGDGWMPTHSDIFQFDIMKEGLAKGAERVGRDPNCFDIIPSMPACVDDDGSGQISSRRETHDRRGRRCHQPHRSLAGVGSCHVRCGTQGEVLDPRAEEEVALPNGVRGTGIGSGGGLH